ncbi:MAG: class I SAM-dependent methyltransferase [Gemmatimonadota bacterium]|nr:class I SAM-dependent methyltransferase [Gemmatimonadota bacterium]
MSRHAHWESVYRTKRPDEVSWYQSEPGISLDLIRATGEGPSARVLDVGGGASVLVDRLLEAGFEHIGVMDIAPAALSASRDRLGPRSDAVEWVEADVLEYRANEPWDIWHDRAVFHFLVDPEDRARYRASLYEAVAPGGHVIVATFGPEGPTRCSGLDTLRCSADEIAAALGDGVTLVESRTEVHRTPSGADQQFVYARLLRVDPTG